MQQIKDGIYITTEGIEALHRESGKRSSKEVAEISQEIYEELKRRYKQLNKDGATGVDSLIYTVERKIGKTEAIIKLADELGLTIVCETKYAEFYRQRKEDVNVVSIGELEQCFKWEGKRYNFHTVLVDEPTNAKRVRKALGGILACSLCPVNILGVQ